MIKKRGDSQCDSVNYGGKILINICLQFKMSEHFIKDLLLIKFDSLDPVFIIKVDYMIFLIYVHPLSEQSIINPYHRLSVDYLLHVVNKAEIWTQKIIISGPFQRISPTGTVTLLNIVPKVSWELPCFGKQWGFERFYLLSIMTLIQRSCILPEMSSVFIWNKVGVLWAIKSETSDQNC